jgi:hypothetical protein
MKKWEELNEKDQKTAKHLIIFAIVIVIAAVIFFTIRFLT